MFLSDELLKLGMSIDMSNEQSINDTVFSMYDMCKKDTLDKIGQFDDYKTIISCFRRTNWIWNEIRKQLISAGIDVLREDGFRLIVESQGNGDLFGKNE